MGLSDWLFGTPKQEYSDNHEPAGTSDEGRASKYVQSNGAKIAPEVDIVEVEPHESGDGKHLELWVTLRNNSEFEVQVMRIELLKQRVMPGRFLKPNEEHELQVYRGDTPTNDSERKAYVQYKIVENTDMFQAEFRVDYHYDDDKYIPEEFVLIKPIRDI